MMLVMVFTHTSCNISGEYKVAGEKDATDVISCHEDNMFGLEKIVVFKDRAVFVFNVKSCDDSLFEDIGDYISSYRRDIELGIGNINDDYPERFKSEIEIKRNRCEVTVSFNNKDKYKEDPVMPFEVYALWLGDMRVYFFDDQIRLEYLERGYDIITHYKQIMDISADEWDAVETSVEGFDLDF